MPGPPRRAGRLDEAIRAYTTAIASSPGSAFLYRELAGVERQRGDATAALAHFRTALDLDPADAGSLTGIGDLLEAGGDFDGAAKAYADALAIEQSAAVQAKLDALRARAELARLPAQYRAIDRAPQITRGELAALDWRAAGAAAAARSPCRRRADHRRARRLGGDLDPDGRPRPASWSRSPTTRFSRAPWFAGSILRRPSSGCSCASRRSRRRRPKRGNPRGGRFRIWRRAISRTPRRRRPSRRVS